MTDKLADGKVVPLHTNPSPISGAKVLLNDCEAQTVIGLKNLFRHMFERADDLLFEMADKGDSAESQEIYVEGMRIVRIKRAQMERAFAEELRKGFKEYAGRTGPSIGGHKASDDEGSQLSLVEEDELEESLALSTMGERAESRYVDVLGTLTKRFARLNPARADLEIEDMPYGPRAIVDALKVSSGILSVSIRVKVIVYKLFDKLVINKMGDLYHELDERLAKAGVAPEVKVAKKLPGTKADKDSSKNEDTGDTAGTEEGAAQAPQADVAMAGVAGPNADEMRTAEQLLDTLHRLLMRQRGTAGGAVAGAQGFVGGQGFGSGVGGGGGLGSVQTVSGGDLIRGLTNLQLNMDQMLGGGGGGGGLPGGGGYSAGAEVGAAGGGFGGGVGGGGGFPAGFSVGGSGAPTSNVKTLLLNQMGMSEGNAAQVRGLDEDVIDVVGMLFEFILADTNLHPRAKATISRLQIPMIKVALLDKTFFSRKQHPARRLLNTLARSSLGMSEATEDGDAVLKAVENVVNRVLDEFDDNIMLFEQLLDEFQQAVATLEQRTQRMEERQVKTMEGQEKLEFSKKQVDQDVAERIQTTPLPKGMRQFFEEKWRHHLLMTCLKAGRDGQEYKDALAVMDKLIWSIEPKQNPKERQAVVDSLRPLLTELRDALADTFMDPEVHKAPFFKELQAFQLAALRGQDPASGERKEMGENPPAPPPKPDPALMGAVVDPNLPDEVVQEIKAQTAAQGEQTPDGYSDSAMGMEVGSWMELESETGSPVRVKLSWRSPLSARCLFVNSRGLKELEVTTDEIAGFLRDGKLTPLEGAPLVDRAMGAVVSGLNGSK